MRNTAKYISIVLVISNFTFIMSQDKREMEKLLWIVDKWVSSEGDHKSYEEWEKKSDDLYTGNSKTLKNGEVIFSEKLKIENTPDGIFYIADVKHNPEPVKFRLTNLSDTSAVFENPEHDFPQRITYLLDGGNLHAFIEGPGKDGKIKKVDFYFSKER